MKKSTFLTLACMLLSATGFISAQDTPYPYEDFETVKVYTIPADEYIDADGLANEAIWSNPHVKEYPIAKILHDWGVDPVDNTWGYEASFQAVRDANYLYLFIKVKDNTYVPFDAQMKSDTEIDNIELFFFPNPDDKNLVYENLDARPRGLSQIRVSVGNTANRVTGGGYAMGFANDNYITGFEYATAQTAEGYNIEVVVPFDIIVSDDYVGNLEPGKKILFDVNAANCTSYDSKRMIILGWSGDDYHSWRWNPKYGDMVFMADFPTGISNPSAQNVKYTFANNELELIDVENNAKVSICDLSGRTVGLYNYNGEKINLSNLVSGIYLVQVGNAGSVKIVK